MEWTEGGVRGSGGGGGEWVLMPKTLQGTEGMGHTPILARGGLPTVAGAEEGRREGLGSAGVGRRRSEG